MKQTTDTIRCAAFLAAALVTTGACAVDIAKGYYFRYDFSSGIKEFGNTTSQSADPCGNSSITGSGTYGQDGVNTAFYISNTAYGSDKIGGAAATGRTVLAGNWTLAMSLKPGSVNKGVLISLGRANENGCKAIFFASSSSPGSLWVGTARKVIKSGKYEGGNRELAKEWELTTSADLTKGFHSIIAVHTTGGTVKIYIDGELAETVDTTENCSAATCVFGNGIQFNQIHGGGDMISGYTSGANSNRAFLDVRLYADAFTDANIAEYAALYPAELPPFSNLDAYANVEAFGVNAVDTGYRPEYRARFFADFEFTDTNVGAGRSHLFGVLSGGPENNYSTELDGNTHTFHIDDSGNFVFAKFTTWDAGKTFMSLGAADTRRHKLSIVPNFSSGVITDVPCTLVDYATRATEEAVSTAPCANNATSRQTTYLFANNNLNSAEGFSKAKIYSYEVMEASNSFVVYAPTTNSVGAAGFKNLITGAFYGEKMASPATPLVFTPGIGQASDYRYRGARADGKFYARVYASSSNVAGGLVKFEGGEAAGTNAQYIVRGMAANDPGRSATIIAVPRTGYTVEWSGDTWAIIEGSIMDETIQVRSDRAIHLIANFKREPAVWTNEDGTGEFESEDNWDLGEIPDEGEDFIVHVEEDTVLTLNDDYVFGTMYIEGEGTVVFEGTGSIAVDRVIVRGGASLVVGSGLSFTHIRIEADAAATLADPSVLASGGLTGSGTFRIDPGAGNVVTMPGGNVEWHGRAVVMSGTVKYGSWSSFGDALTDRSALASILVMGGAALDQNGQSAYKFNSNDQLGGQSPMEKPEVILQGNAVFTLGAPTGQDMNYSAVTILTLEGDATVTNDHRLSISEALNSKYTHFNLGANTLTKTGTNDLYISACDIAGMGTFDVRQGSITISSSRDPSYCPGVFTNGTLRIAEGAALNFVCFDDIRNGTKPGSGCLTVKNLVLDGTVTRESKPDHGESYLKVTGYVTGHGTTPMLTMDEDAVFKPDGAGYLAITEKIEGTIKVDISDPVLADKGVIPLVKVSMALASAADSALDLSAVPSGWMLKKKTEEGNAHYYLAKGLAIFLR